MDTHGETGVFCTGILIAGQAVLTAAHCYGSDLDRGIASTNGKAGDPNCVIEDWSSGKTIGTGGCGQATFYQGVPVDTINVAHVWTNGVHATTKPANAGAGWDMAIAVLARRASPLTAAQASSFRVWRAFMGDSGWNNYPIKYYGWGAVDTCTNCACFDNPSVLPKTLSFRNDKALDASDPVSRYPSDFCGTNDVGAPMFVTHFDITAYAGGLNHGDSGGPLFQKQYVSSPPFSPRVLGVEHGDASCCDISGDVINVWARTMDTTSNNDQFLSDELYNGNSSADRPLSEDVQCGGPNDLDGDCVPSVGSNTKWIKDRDNCPDDYNPDQIDTDGDHIGDACDTCPNTPDDGTNTNFEAEGVLAGMASPPWSFTHVRQLNSSNTVANNAKFFPADACDTWAINAPRNTDRTTNQPPPTVPTVALTELEWQDDTGGPGGRCGKNLVPCPTNSKAGIDYEPFAANPGFWNGGSGVKQGWRRCLCTAPDDPDFCELNGCPREASLFDAQSTGPSWFEMTIEGADSMDEFSQLVGLAPTGQPPYTIPSDYLTRWLWWNDPNVDTTCIAKLKPLLQGQTRYDVCNTRGRVWWFTTQNNLGTRTSSLGVAADHYSVYTSIQLDQTNPEIIVPQNGWNVNPVRLPLPCHPCVTVTADGEAWINQQDPSPSGVRVWSVSPSGPAVEVTGDFSPAALSAINGADRTLLGASEPVYRLLGADVAAIVLDGSNNVVSVLQRDPQTYAIDVQAQGFSDFDPPVGPDVALALSGVNHIVAAAGIGKGETEGSVWLNDFSGWTRIATLRGETPARGLSMTSGNDNGVFYLLDEKTQPKKPNSKRIRLLSIEPNGSVVLLGEWKRRDADARYFVASSYYADGLLLACTWGEKHEMELVQLRGDKVIGARGLRAKGRMDMAPSALREGVAWAQIDPKTNRLTTHSTSYNDFEEIDLKDQDENNNDEGRRCFF